MKTKSIKQVQQEIASLMNEMKKSDFVGIFEQNDKGYYSEAYDSLRTAHLYLGLADLEEAKQNGTKQSESSSKESSK